MKRALAGVRRLVLRHRGPVAVVLAITLLRLATTGGLTPAVANEVYLLSLTALVLLWCLRILIRAEPVELRRPGARRRNWADVRPTRLVRLEERVEWWVRTAEMRHIGLRPAVRVLTATRLGRVGIDIDDDERAAAALGPLCWELVRSGVEPPASPAAAGLTPAEVHQLTRTLTTLNRPDFGHMTQQQGTGEH